MALKLKNKKQKNEEDTGLKFFSYEPILSYKCKYNVIFGERSNGKTYGALEIALVDYIEHGNQAAYIRRFYEDIRGKRGTTLCAPFETNGKVKELTNGKWDHVRYYSSRWYLARHGLNDKIITDEEPFMFGFSLNDMEHDKSTSYPRVCNIIFDEFITRQYYLTDEFVLFMNVLSTIIRFRDNVRIFMLGNTVNKYCPYFKEMGLKHISEMKPGDIDVYTYNNPGLTVAVQYATMGENSTKKKSDSYFAFDNPKLEMITGGVWELEIYPHLPMRYKPKDVLLNYFIKFDERIMHCEIIQLDDIIFTYIHEKTTPIQNEDEDIIFSTEYDPRPNWFRNIRRPRGKLDTKISEFFRADKVYYQDNEVGEVIRNYLIWCAKSSSILG